MKIGDRVKFIGDKSLLLFGLPPEESHSLREVLTNCTLEITEIGTSQLEILTHLSDGSIHFFLVDFSDVTTA
jgi:hypothetical protein